MFTQEKPRTSEEHFRKCSSGPDRIAIWWCWFLKGGRTEAPAEKPLTSRSQVLIRSDGSSTFFDLQLLLVTQLWYTTLTPSHPFIQSWSSNFWTCSCIASNFYRGERADHKRKIMVPSLNYFWTHSWPEKLGPVTCERKTFSRLEMFGNLRICFSLLRCLQLFRQPTCAVIGSCCLYWLPKRPHKTQLLILVRVVLWTFFKMAANKHKHSKSSKENVNLH